MSQLGSGQVPVGPERRDLDPTHRGMKEGNPTLRQGCSHQGAEVQPAQARLAALTYYV